MQIAAITAQRTQEQADYWVTAKNDVPPVPPTPKSVGLFSDPGEWAAQKMDWFPGVTSDQERAKKLQLDAAEQARQAMRVYQASSNPNLDAAPAFTAPQALDGSVGSLPLTGASVGGYGGPPTLAGGNGTPAHLMSASSPAAHQPVAPSPALHQPASSAPAATVSQLALGESAGAAGTVTPERWTSNPAAANQAMFPGALAAGVGFGGGSTAKPASVSTGARLAGAGGAGIGAGRHAPFGPRPSAEFGPRPTVGLTPLEETSSARSGAAGAVRTAGAAGYGQPFVGSAGQQGEQDREHRSKYLLHDDSNSIVGDLPPTAPPVIGADY
jgi:hypothetical protein